MYRIGTEHPLAPFTDLLIAEPYIRASTMTAFAQCPRLFFYQHRLGLSLNIPRVSRAISIGTYVHLAMQEVLQHPDRPWLEQQQAILKAAQPSLDALQPGSLGPNSPGGQAATESEQCLALALAMVGEFVRLYPPTSMKLIACEAPLAVHTTTPEPGGWLAGTPDAIVESDKGELWIIDHKTTSEPPSVSLSGRAWAYQTFIYPTLVTQVYGRAPVGFIYNFLQKASIRFCKKDATFEAYVDRCREWWNCCGESPFQSYYVRTDTASEGYRGFLVDLQATVHASTQPVNTVSEAYATFPRRAHQCLHYGRRCIYYDLCQAHAARLDELVKAYYRQDFQTPTEEGDTG